MVYMDADNNLEPYGIADFAELASVGSSSQVNIVVQYDRIANYSTGYGNWTDTRRFRITRGMTPDAANGTSIGEVNMGNPQTLINFVQWAKKTYPAQHYALVLWDHGGGWRAPIVDPAVQKTIAVDDSSGGDRLNAPELRGAYEAISSGGSDPLDLVGFDACLMGMIEVDGQLIPYAEVRVGSEETEPGEGWPYETILADLSANPAMTPAQLGAAIVHRYYASYGGETMSAVNLGAPYTTLNSAVNSFALALINKGGPHYAAIRDARSSTQDFYDANFVDLYDFAAQVRQRVSEPGIQAAAAQVMNAVTGAVIAENHGSYWPGAHGISVYFPGSKERFDSKYNGDSDWLQFTRNTAWDDWLRSYYTGTSLPAPTLIEPASGTLSANGTPTFRWNVVAGAKAYRIQVDNDANFASPVINMARTTAAMTPSTPLGSKTFYWRVKAKDVNDNWSAWSATWTLTLDRVKPAVSTLTTPGNGAVVSTSKPGFKWTNPSPDVAFYRIQIDKVSTFASPVINEVAPGSSYVPPAALTGSIYFWRIQAYDWAGNRGPWTTGWKVQINTTIAAIVPAGAEPPTPTLEPTTDPTLEPTALPTELPTITPTPTDAPVTLQTIESDSALVLQAGVWTAHDTPEASGGRYSYTSGAPSDVLTLRFSGTHLDLVYVRHPALGTLAVEIDGIVVQAIDSRAADTEFGARATFTLAPGEHTVRVFALSGTIAVDAFAVESALEPRIEPATTPTIAPMLEATTLPTGTPVPTIELTLPPATEPTIAPTVEPTLPPPVEQTPEPTTVPPAESTMETPVAPAQWG